MRAHIIKIDAQSADPEIIREIVRVLQRDGVVVYPTDTFYGLGAHCLSKKAIQKIFRMKKRPGSKGLPVLVSDLEIAMRTAADVPPVFFGLAGRFWPGPLTLVTKAASHLPRRLVGPRQSVGIRLPDIPWLQVLIGETGIPLISTSANISGQGEIASPEEVFPLFQDKVDLIVDGGTTPGGLPSTVVDLTGEKPILVREGVIGKKELDPFF